MNEHEPGYEGWRVVAACSVAAFFATVPLNAFAVFLKPLTADFSWSRENAASAFGTMTLLGALSAPLWGILLDRFGAHRLVGPCLALSGCAVASLSALTSSIWHFRVALGAIGLVTMGASAIAYSRAIFGWFDTLRGRALGLVLAGAASSSIVVAPVAETLVRVAGWRIAWLALGSATVFVASPIAIRFIRDRPRPKAVAATAHDAHLEGALRSRVFWTLVLVVFAGTAAINGAIVHMAALLGDRGVAASRAAFALSAMGAASLAGRLGTGWLLDKFSAIRVSVAMLTIAALGTFLLSAAHALGTGMIAAICIGFGSGGEFDVVPYLLSRSFGLRSLSTLYGFTWTAWGLAGATGPILMGRAFDATGSYTTALVELGFITLAAAALMLTLPAVPRRAVALEAEMR